MFDGGMNKQLEEVKDVRAAGFDTSAALGTDLASF